MYLLLALIAYVSLAHILRFRRLRGLHKKYNYTSRQSMSSMTDDEAWEIQKTLLQLEFPTTAFKSIQFALFKTYAIPSISTLLAKTGQFSNTSTAYKRYSDTSVLIGEFTASKPSSDRARTAIARTNLLHSAYRASGKIRDDDMLYTLSLFAGEPIRFISRFEWRPLSELEKCAVGTFWKSLGDALDISYDHLPSSKDGFRDGIHWLEEIMAWSRAYEEEHMVPHPKNKEVADKTVDILLFGVPEFLKPLGCQFVSYMMEDRLREAMLYKPPPGIISQIFSFGASIRKQVLRHLALPRPYFLRYDYFTETPDVNGRNFLLIWDAAPYYVKPTIWNRWGPTAWLAWARGLPLPGDNGGMYYPHGYDVLDLGPKYYEGKGMKQVDEIRAALGEKRTGGCPFH